MATEMPAAAARPFLRQAGGSAAGGDSLPDLDGGVRDHGVLRSGLVVARYRRWPA
jgi:hypothetical protein